MAQGGVLVSVVACSGRELAAVEADRSWQLRDLLAAVPEPDRVGGRRIFFGVAELCGSVNLGELGVQDGSELTLVVTEITLICDGNEANLWDAASGECLRTLRGHQSFVTSAVFSPDRQRALTASWDQTAKIWDAGSGDCLLTLRGHQLDVLSAVFSPDGRRALTASSDATAKTWDAESGDCLRTLRGHHSSVRSAVFSPDGQRALTASLDHTAKICARFAATARDCEVTSSILDSPFL